MLPYSFICKKVHGFEGEGDVCSRNSILSLMPVVCCLSLCSGLVCWGSCQIGESWLRTGLGLKWEASCCTNLGMDSTTSVASLTHNSRFVKDWAAILKVGFLSLAPKRHPDFILSAFRTLSLIKNKAKICFDMVPCVRQRTAALLLFCAQTHSR